MIRAFELLEQKNMYLEKFMALNRDWLDKLTKDDFSDVDEFRENREKILNIIKTIDDCLSQETMDVEFMDVHHEGKLRIMELFERKEALVHGILAQDLDIMQIIDEAKNGIISELQKIQKSRKMLKSYKSYRRTDSVDEEV